MAVVLAASQVRTCFGDGDQTFAALCRGDSGVAPLRHPDPAGINVRYGYHGDGGGPFLASRWLVDCVRRAVAEADLRPGRQRVVALVGTGLRELAAVEEWAVAGREVPRHRLHFRDALAEAVPGLADIITIANACSAGGHALALAQDLVEMGEADAVVAAAADGMTSSMLAMIGRVADVPTERVRPFDAARQGVLLGEGAAAAVVVSETTARSGLARLLATGLSCDAYHETAPDVAGICRAMRDALSRGDRSAADVDLVVAHGTGTALNDPTECAALRQVLRDGGGDPLITAIKGAVGHTSGSAGLVSLDVAVRCLASGVVPPVVGLRTVLPEGDGLRFALQPVRVSPRLVQVDAFGFGGVNAVTLLEPLPGGARWPAST
ncbi:beta-ketoacyl synthase N-terminal-like domain-containing protein [Micromonospora sp. CPCC 206061]|uniref:beta-ketoacyl synthase N-terminal-like domain-containing protein n=1 Tax=Micromonospora sp. CPCC 206061 TaxID=3122410 RepID=UPI002FF34666